LLATKDVEADDSKAYGGDNWWQALDDPAKDKHDECESEEYVCDSLVAHMQLLFMVFSRPD
jgi:hypothetical protein